jgi:hypothetical protein
MTDDRIEAKPPSNRREELLTDLLSYMDGVHRRRRHTRLAVGWGLAAVPTIFLAFIAVQSFKNSVPNQQQPIAVHRPNAPELQPGSPRAFSFELVKPQAGAAAHNAVAAQDKTRFERIEKGTPSLVQYVGDEELVRTLAQINRPAGLIRFGDRVWLTQPVADEDMQRARLAPPS